MPVSRPLAVVVGSSSVPEPNSGCFLWFGAQQKDGYGVVSHRGRNLLAHRAAWEVAHGAAPPRDKYVLHRCDVPWCVNPAHLYLGTQYDNMRDAVQRKRHCNSKKTHCKRGHALAGGNLYRYTNKGRPARSCNICHTAAAMARRTRP